MYVQKVERKGRTQDEVDQVITRLTGFDKRQIDVFANDESTFPEFFDQAELNPHADLVAGVIRGVRVEEIEGPLIQKARSLDKLVDQVAKGKAMERILRS